MSSGNATTLCLTGVAFGAVGLMTRLFAVHPLLVLRCLTGRRLRRTPHAWSTSGWQRGMRGMSWLQLALGAALLFVGGCWRVL